MGRKKKPRVSAELEPEVPQSAPPADPRLKPPPPPPPVVAKIESDDGNIQNDGEKEVKASNYAITSHSGEIVEEDTYVSSGSEDEDEVVEVVLSGSKMGLMRRGLHQPLLVQPNLREWVRPKTTDSPEQTDKEQQEKKEAELEALDPAERAARLLVEKQRKLEEAKESARRIESEENAGRDPCLFSKRTAFDIRFDQIDDKPWERGNGNGDLTDFFNYSLTVEDWLEYAQQQLTIRQELTDASRQKRPPDPNIVPVAARKPKSQTPKVAVAASKDKQGDGDKASGEGNTSGPTIGPEMIKKEDRDGGDATNDSSNDVCQDVHVGDGGAWGAGAAPDSMLARLIAEQSRKENGALKTEPMPTVQSHHQNQSDYYSDNKHNHREDVSMQHGAGSGNYDNRGSSEGYDDQQASTYGGGDWRQHRPPPPPPPPPTAYHGHDDGGGMFGGSYNGHDDGMGGRFGGRFGGRGRGRGRGGRFNSYGRGGRGCLRPPFPPHGQRWGGRGRDSWRPRDECRGGGGYGGGGY